MKKIIILLFLLNALFSQDLKLVIVIFRHGAREALITDHKGPLTEAGKAMEYILGRELRTRYIQYFFLPM